jgi:hypothetical protein
MNKTLGLIALAGLSTLILGGCNNSTNENLDNDKTPAESLIGTWKQKCYSPSWANGDYLDDTRVFTDKNLTITRVFYATDECKVINESKGYTIRYFYKVGKTTEDSEGKQATEIERTMPEMGHARYTMFKFKKNGNLLCAGGKDDHDGSSPEKRANYFDPDWKGWTKVEK